MSLDKYIVRYWPHGLGRASKTQDCATQKEAREVGTEQGLEGNYYCIYECRVIKSNLDE